MKNPPFQHRNRGFLYKQLKKLEEGEGIQIECCMQSVYTS